MEKNVTITKKFEFSASHRYWREDWSEEKNNKEFGLCVSPYGHGHNYELYVTVGGQVDAQTGMIINLTDLKKLVNKILINFDHKFLNLDTPYFRDKIPTTENIALVLFEQIKLGLSSLSGRLKLSGIRLYERFDLFAEVWEEI
ncbi:MAG: 6-carboxytetrahydropterin synthase [Calditrichaceae bacterium]|nr:6-carboxytetrahydropterin synthase [Calditrichaceae bacterium]MBN2707973.1 6-carboxytetrahydropterin synthase [Calditrichaceae bacterium]RQV95926.1 MAG: 6-carboxytetrahydropterin synthase [Calditrichota bacterium]